ncbi:acyl-CoA dehydrogenase family protein [Paenibacillus sp. 2TAB23]|uniref:acyl-CoA dehydrogenase family protein n=1 Tax=Paenibacillus sp. 2TAB23 TaxID=3233004 RepID=UPI003F9BC0A4
MELRFTREQADLQEAVRQFAEQEIAPVVHEMEETDQFPSSLLAKMAQKGWMGIPIPKKWNGAGLDFISYIIAIHEISKVSAAVGVILSVHTSVGTIPILKYGNDEQIAKFVPSLAAGEALGAFALTEPQAGSDAAAIRTSAELAGDHYTLNGSKLFITNAGVAQTYVTFAVTDTAKGSYGISAFIVEQNTAGFAIGRKERKLGLHGSNTCEIMFDQVRLPVAQRLGREGNGFEIALGALDGGRIGIAAQALGIAEAALRLTNERMNQSFMLYGRTTAVARNNKAKWAELTIQVEAAKMLVYRAAYLRQQGLPCTKEASAAKMYAADTAVRVTNEAMAILDMDGCLRGSGIERMFRDAKATQIYEGTNEIHRIVISGQLLK